MTKDTIVIIISLSVSLFLSRSPACGIISTTVSDSPEISFLSPATFWANEMATHFRSLFLPRNSQEIHSWSAIIYRSWKANLQDNDGKARRGREKIRFRMWSGWKWNTCFQFSPGFRAWMKYCCGREYFFFFGHSGREYFLSNMIALCENRKDPTKT